MINNGFAHNQANLAKKLGVSRARISQILNILKLPDKMVNTLEELEDNLAHPVITERQLRVML